MSMLNSFESQGSECLLEGVLYDQSSSHSRYDYDMEIPVSEPALESCSDICKTMNIKHQYANKINQLTASNVMVSDCQLFSFVEQCYVLNQIQCGASAVPEYRKVHSVRRALGDWRF